MNTNRNLRMVKFAPLALLLAAIGPSWASAQDFQGKFTLPFEAQWGNTILQPGSYTLTVGRFQGGQREVMVQTDAGAKATAIIMTQSQNPSPSLSRNNLVCVRGNRGLAVRALEVAPLGETIYFTMPKGDVMYAEKRDGKEPPLLAQSPELIQRIPVEAAR